MMNAKAAPTSSATTARLHPARSSGRHDRQREDVALAACPRRPGACGESRTAVPRGGWPICPPSA
eukprot:9324452-Pyramimonas_sp.AAC.2